MPLLRCILHPSSLLVVDLLSQRIRVFLSLSLVLGKHLRTSILSGRSLTSTFRLLPLLVITNMCGSFTTPISFNLQVNTSTGAITVPQFGGQVTLSGRESKILVTEYPFGKSLLKYSTAEVGLSFSCSTLFHLTVAFRF